MSTFEALLKALPVKPYPMIIGRLILMLRATGSLRNIVLIIIALNAHSSIAQKIARGSTVLSGPITLTITSSNPSCGYNNGSILIKAAGGTPPYVFSLNGTIQNNGYFPQLNAAGNGTYSVLVTDAAGQSASAQVILSDILPPPDLSIQAGSRPSTCTSADGSVVLTGSGGLPPYQYSMDGINYSPVNTIGNLTRGLYVFFVKDANGCTRERDFGYLGEFEALNPCALQCNGEGGLTACKNDGRLDIVAFGGVPPYKYSIDGVNFQTSAFPNSSNDFTNLPSGLYHLFVMDANRTLVTAAYQLIQNCDVSIVFVGVDATCGQSDGSIVVHASRGTAPYTFSIDGENYQTDSLFAGLASGNYSITVRDANGVASSRPVAVFNKCPTVSAVATDETCGMSNGSIVTTGAKGSLPYLFSLDGINFQLSNVFNSLPANNYTVTIKDANGFTNTTSVTVKNNCLKLSLGINSATCGQPNGNISAVGSGGADPYSYSIDGVNFSSTGQFGNLGPGAYTVTMHDANGLATSVIGNIMAVPPPKIAVTTGQAGCMNTGGSISIAVQNGTNPFQYSIDNGVTLLAGNVFNNLDSGLYFAYVKDANGCIVSDTVQISALATPIVFLGKDTALCSGDSLLLTAPSGPGNSYQWQDNSNGDNYLVKNSGTYSVQVTNQYGCTATAAINIRFNPLPVFDLTRDTSVCGGTTVSLQPVLPAGKYSWSTGSQAKAISIDASGLYWLQVVDNSGCLKRDSIQVNYKPVPAISLGNDTTLCQGQSLLIDVTNNNASYAWQDGSTTSIYKITAPGIYSVKVMEDGCDTAGTITVQFTTKPVIALVKDTTLCISQELQLNASCNQCAYIWQDGSTGPQYIVREAATYTVEVSNDCGVTTDTVVVKFDNCECKVHIPGAFTPNRSSNSVFRPKFQCLFGGYSFTVYNRWGMPVFSSRDPNSGWDGSYKGQPQPTATYVWTIEYKDDITGRLVHNQGVVILIR